MPLVLAIEPDSKQADVLKWVVVDRLRSEFVLTDSLEAARAALDERIPDLILLSALLSPRDEAEFSDYLRNLEGAEHLQTLTVPRLGAVDQRQDSVKSGGLLSAFRWKRAAPAPAGCDPSAYADEVKRYLSLALDERALRLARREREAREAEADTAAELTLESMTEPVDDPGDAIDVVTAMQQVAADSDDTPTAGESFEAPTFDGWADLIRAVESFGPSGVAEESSVSAVPEGITDLAEEAESVSAEATEALISLPPDPWFNLTPPEPVEAVERADVDASAEVDTPDAEPAFAQPDLLLVPDEKTPTPEETPACEVAAACEETPAFAQIPTVEQSPAVEQAACSEARAFGEPPAVDEAVRSIEAVLPITLDQARETVETIEPEEIDLVDSIAAAVPAAPPTEIIAAPADLYETEKASAEVSSGGIEEPSIDSVEPPIVDTPAAATESIVQLEPSEVVAEAYSDTTDARMNAPDGEPAEPVEAHVALAKPFVQDTEGPASSDPDPSSPVEELPEPSPATVVEDVIWPLAAVLAPTQSFAFETIEDPSLDPIVSPELVRQAGLEPVTIEDRPPDAVEAWQPLPDWTESGPPLESHISLSLTPKSSPAETVQASSSASPADRGPDAVAIAGRWIASALAAVRSEIQMLRAERLSPAAATASSVAPSEKPEVPSQPETTPPVQSHEPDRLQPEHDELVLYDSSQCGFEAPFAAIEAKEEAEAARNQELDGADPLLNGNPASSPPQNSGDQLVDTTAGRPRLAPLSLWARFERESVDPMSASPGDRDDVRDLIAGLAIPTGVASVAYPRGCRIRRLRMTHADRPRTPQAPDDPVIILSRRRLREDRAEQEEPAGAGRH